jgi:hypothetical protein
MMKTILRSLLFIGILLCAGYAQSLAAGMGSGPPAPCGGPFPPCPIPLDGGISFLLVAGAAFGGKKAYDWKKKSE